MTNPQQRRGDTQLADLTEQDWDGQLFRGDKALARMLGWTSYHTLRSKGSQSGFPDRTLFRERVIFAELKREKGKPTDTQVYWLTGLAKAGAEVYLWLPSDLHEIGQVLSSRGLPLWPRKSLWMPAGCRWDQMAVAA